MNLLAKLLLEMSIDLRLSVGPFTAFSSVCRRQCGTVAKIDGVVFGSYTDDPDCTSNRLNSHQLFVYIGV